MTATFWWSAIGAMVAVVALWRAKQLNGAGLPTAATLIVGCLGTLLSPISWPHHQLWAVLAGIWLLLQRRISAIVVGMATIVVFLGYSFFMEVPDPGVAIRLGWEIPLLMVALICIRGLQGDVGRWDYGLRSGGRGSQRT